MPRPRRQFSYPPGAPAWQPVPPEALLARPYLQICSLLALQGGTPINAGTGWLCAPGTVATAAHVLLGADSCRVRWGSTQEVYQTTNFTLHPAFNPNLIASDVDLARINGVPGPSEPLEPFLAGAAFVVAAGFQSGMLVAHEDAAKLVPPYAGHDAHTDVEHSGCPLLVGDKVLALHLGTAAATRRHMSASQKRKLNTRNSGILIGSASTEFLYS